MPGWLGEPLDVGWALDVLHPDAAPPRILPLPPEEPGEAAGGITD